MLLISYASLEQLYSQNIVIIYTQYQRPCSKFFYHRHHEAVIYTSGSWCRTCTRCRCCHRTYKRPIFPNYEEKTNRMSQPPTVKDTTRNIWYVLVIMPFCFSTNSTIAAITKITIRRINTMKILSDAIRLKSNVSPAISKYPFKEEQRQSTL